MSNGKVCIDREILKDLEEVCNMAGGWINEFASSRDEAAHWQTIQRVREYFGIPEAL